MYRFVLALLIVAALAGCGGLSEEKACKMAHAQAAECLKNNKDTRDYSVQEGCWNFESIGSK